MASTPTPPQASNETATKTPTTTGSSQKTRIIFVHGDKGGVGKSMVSRSLADYLSVNKETVAVVDADTSNPDVQRMFANNLVCQSIDLRAENGWMDLIDFVKEHLGQSIIVNLPAGIGDQMKTHLSFLALFLNEQKSAIETEMWWTMNVTHDAVNLLDVAIKAYGKFFNKIRVVCNLHFAGGDREQFFLWQESPLKAKVEMNNGQTVYLPGLHMRVIKKLFDPENIMPFSEAMDLGLGERVALTTAELYKLKLWHIEMQQCFAPTFGHAAPQVKAAA